ncbi:MAG TPA: AAA family ATPase, partial [Streptosporangiaceae bacterium]
MYGLKLKTWKSSLLIVASLMAIILAFSYLPPALLVTFGGLVFLLGGSYVIGRNTWKQAKDIGSRPSLAAGARPVGARPQRGERKSGGRKSRAEARASRKVEILHPEETVTLSGEREAADIEDVFTSLDNQLVGLVPVKKKVEEIASLLLVDRVRHRFGLDAPRPNLHMCFTGDPGTGKTTVALQMADLLFRLGYLEKGHLVHAMRDDLVGEFIGHTAPKTKRTLERAMGGVLFIDEAYYLYRSGDSKDYGQECIDILLQVMENDR